MVHILFGQSTTGCLENALQRLGVAEAERIISFWEMFSIGPIWQLKDKTNEIKVINTSKIFAKLFNRPDTKYFVLHTGEVSPDKLQVIYEETRLQNRAKQLHKRKNTKELMQSARLIGDVLGHLEQYVGDGFLEYRLKKLIEKRVFYVEGSMEAMRLYSVGLSEYLL